MNKTKVVKVLAPVRLRIERVTIRELRPQLLREVVGGVTDGCVGGTDTNCVTK